MNKYAAVFGKETITIDATHSDDAKRKAAIVLGIPSHIEWQIKTHRIDRRVPVKFKQK